jgi:hypothetical protein
MAVVALVKRLSMNLQDISDRVECLKVLSFSAFLFLLFSLATFFSLIDKEPLSLVILRLFGLLKTLCTIKN